MTNPTIQPEHVRPVRAYILRNGSRFPCWCPVVTWYEASIPPDYSNALVTVANDSRRGKSYWRVRCRKHQRESAKLAMRKRRRR